MKPKAALFGILLCIYSISVWYRFQILNIIEVRSDTLSPFWAAMGVMHHGWSPPPNPESDHWLWVTHLPLLLGRNLHEAFALRCMQAALIAPIGAYAAWVLSKRNVLCTIAVGLLLALDPGLRDTLIVGFRGYGAPEWLSLSTLGLVLWTLGKRWGLVLFGATWVIASGQHPLALGAGLGVLFWGYTLRNSGKDIGILVLIVVLFFVPRMLWVWELMQCDAGGIQCLLDIAISSSEYEQSEVILLGQGLWDRFNSEWSWAALIGLWGIVWLDNKSLQRWVILTGVGIIILGLSIHTLRPYHFRILAAPLVVFSVVGWFRKWPQMAVGIMGLWLCWMYLGQLTPLGAEGQIRIHDELGQQLSTADKKVWLVTLDVNERAFVDPSAVVLSAYLQGWDTRFAACAPNQTIWAIKQTSSEWIISLMKEEDNETTHSLSMFDAAIQICTEVDLQL